MKAQASPTSLFKTAPKADELDQINGGAPLTVMFNMCAITDADAGDALGYTYSFGDGATAGHHCRAEHTYEKQGAFEATICAHDKRLADRSEVCATYRVKVRGESEARTPIAQGGSVTLCDQFSQGIAWSGICGIPSDPGTRYFFDFESLQKVPISSSGADLAREGWGPGGFTGLGYWSSRNGAVQANTLVPTSQLATVTCNSSDGRTYSANPIHELFAFENVICLRTGSGHYVRYTARTASGSDGTIDYVAN